MFSAAAAVLALSGVASAFPQAGSNFNATTSGVVAGAAAASGVAMSTGALASATSASNTTSSSTSSSSAAATSGAIKYCPNLDGEIVVGPLDIKYEISCNTNHLGVIIDISLQKRATPTSLTDCLQECSALDQCVAAAFDTEDPTCYLFSTVGAAITANGFQFAEKASALTSSTSSAATAVATSTGNGTTSGNSTVSPLENLFCPQLDAQVYSDGNGDEYIIQCGDNHVGVVISVAHAKRQTAATTSILDCMAQCDANAACVGVGFNTAALTCTLFSSVGAEYYDADVDFALKIAAGTGAAVASATVAGAGTGADIVTATVYTTTLSTILSCAATVTDCPLRGSVVTDTVVAYTTVCPASDLAGAITATGTAPTAAAVIACTDCPYAAVSATIYSTTVSTIYSCPATVTDCPLTSGAAAASASAASASASSAASVTGANSAVAAASGASAAASVASAAGASAVSTVTSMVAIATSLVNYPLPASTVITSAGGATYAGPTATTSGLAAYTGAASALQAGMGMAGAIVAGAAFLL